MTTESWTLRSVTREFLAMERERQLIDGPIGRSWEAARFRIHQRLLVLLGATAEGQIRYESIRPRPVARAWDFLRNSISRPSLMSERADFLFVGHPRRQKTAQGFWSDPYVDPLLPRLGGTAAVVELPYLGRHYAPVSIPGVRHLDDVEVLGAMRRLWMRPSLNDEQQRLVQDTVAEVRERFSVDPGVDTELGRAHASRASLLPFCHALLARVRPKVLVIVVSYGNENLIEAARARGIPTVELQHGTIHPYHLGYTFPEGRKSTFPDYLLTFGRFWNDSTHFPLDPDRVRAVGFPAFDEARGKLTRRPDSTVLFLSQPAVGEQLSRMAVGLSHLTERRIVYKLHPGETIGWRERYPWLAGSSVEIADDPGESVYRSFGTADVQVGVFSTALYEGLGVGVPTVVAQLPGAEACEPLVRLGYARTAADALELCKALSEPSIPPEPEAFFRKGAVERTVTTLRDIVRS